MKFLPLLALLGLTGCQTTYTRLTVTNFDGERVSDWVAEGYVRRVEQGYAIRAVERSVEGAHPVTRRFPNGWRTTVTGANILQEEIEKPAWLVALDAGEGYMHAGGSTQTDESIDYGQRLK
jgi:hypothetical protein